LDRGPGRLNLQSFSPDKYIHLIKFTPEPFPGLQIRFARELERIGGVE
jgi:hypothetical protein